LKGITLSQFITACNDTEHSTRSRSYEANRSSLVL